MGMPKYDRLLHILNLLRARRNMNAAALARECGVTERSVYRDIISLSEANIPIYYDHGYRLASDNFLPPLNFDYEEYHCLRLALDSSPLAKAGYYAEVLRRVRAKVEHVFAVLKLKFGFTKVRYRGLDKNAHRLFVTCALANLFLARHHLLRLAGA